MEFAIIICTYNPREEIFRRVLRAVAELQVPQGGVVEYCIIDNNSDSSVAEWACVKEMQRVLSDVTVVREERQGLRFARLAGARVTSAPTLIFFDDDNVPNPDYLVELQRLLREQRQVGVWGPGTVEVEFVGEVPEWIQLYRSAFQEKALPKTTWGREESWTSYYPAGTGMAVTRPVMDLYGATSYETTDRKGNSLSSGGDAQIVYTAVKAGYAAGTSPRLKVVHLITAERASKRYLKRLLYGANATSIPAWVEVFPERRAGCATVVPPPMKLLRSFLGLARAHLRQGTPAQLPLSLAEYAGWAAGHYAALGRQRPLVLEACIRLLHLE